MKKKIRGKQGTQEDHMKDEWDKGRDEKINWRGNQHHEDEIKEKPSNTIRIYSQNMNGIDTTNYELDFRDKLLHMLDRQPDIIGWSETKVEWNHYESRQKMYNKWGALLNEQHSNNWTINTPYAHCFMGVSMTELMSSQMIGADVLSFPISWCNCSCVFPYAWFDKPFPVITWCHWEFSIINSHMQKSSGTPNL